MGKVKSDSRESSDNEINNLNNVNIPMCAYEEEVLQKKLRLCVKYNKCPTHLRRLYRKLVVKRKNENVAMLKNLQIKPFCMDNVMSNMLKLPIDSSVIGMSRKIQYKYKICNFTDRILPPIIWKSSAKSLWLRNHESLRTTVKQKFPHLEIPEYEEDTLNFTYVNPEHINSINWLLQTYFWPGIDISSCLKYPEFSCVATYKQLIIGFGFMVPGEHWNEGYITFIFVRPHWRRNGIASFILYHLAQTSWSWDISLHVSISNPSLFLYQKFGFKIYRVLCGFYDKYLPANCNESRDALYFKLERI